MIWKFGGLLCGGLCFLVSAGLPYTAKAQAIEGGVGTGTVLKADPYLRGMLQQTSARSLHVAYVHPTTAFDTLGYASDFNYPAFSFGLAVCDFNQVRLHDPNRTEVDYTSRMGTSYVLYASFRRPFFRTYKGWSSDYVIENGVGYSTRVFNRKSNTENEMIGSDLSIYFSLSFHLNYRWRQWEAFAGPEFRHLSNGALARPNKGVNKVGIGMGARYYLHPQEEELYRRVHRAFPDKGFYFNFTYRSGFKTAIGEWLVDLHSKGANPYGTYPLYVSHGFSTDGMYRYSRRFASGLGMDFLYEPSIRRVETQNTQKPTPKDMSKWSVGVSAKHEVFFHRVSMQMSMGYYLSRPFADYAITDEEYGYYERIGLRYRLPWFNNCLSVGYNIHAHRTKAYESELALDWHIPIKRR